MGLSNFLNTSKNKGKKVIINKYKLAVVYLNYILLNKQINLELSYSFYNNKLTLN